MSAKCQMSYNKFMKINFYNIHSYGDIVFTRPIANWIAEHIPSEHQVYYYHMKNLNSIPFHTKVRERKYNMSIDMAINGLFGDERFIKHFKVYKNELYINAMMYASAAFVKKNNGDVFCPRYMNTESLKLKADEIVTEINKVLKTSIPYPEELNLLPVRANVSKSKTLIDIAFSNLKYRKNILTCNGDTLSEQSLNINLVEELSDLINTNNDCLFVFTEKKNNPSYSNVLYFDELFPENTIGDIEYASKYFDILVGRSSGPSHTYFNYENCYTEPKTIVELTLEIERAFFHMKGNATYVHSKDFEKNKFSETISSLLV